MSRTAMGLGPLVVLLVLAGCATYHKVDVPWRDAPAGGEFVTHTTMHEGDQVRVTTAGAQVTEGLLVDYDGLQVTVVDTVGTVRLVTVPVDSVRLIEVREGDSVKNVATAMLGVTGTILTIWMIDDLLDDKHTVDYDLGKAR